MAQITRITVAERASAAAFWPLRSPAYPRHRLIWEIGEIGVPFEIGEIGEICVGFLSAAVYRHAQPRHRLFREPQEGGDGDDDEGEPDKAGA